MLRLLNAFRVECKCAGIITGLKKNHAQTKPKLALNRIYFETRSFSSSGSRCFLTQRRSLIERGLVLI